MLRRLILTALLFALAPLSHSADNGIYIGAGYAQSDYSLRNPAGFTGFDDEDSGFKVIAGFRPLDKFALELNYTDHGNVRIDGSFCPPEVFCTAQVETLRAGAETISGFAVGFLDFPLIDLYAKVGGSSWQFDGSAVPAVPGFDVDESDFDFAWGAGAWAHFGSLGARLEYERFKIVDEDIGTISLSFVYTFL